MGADRVEVGAASASVKRHRGISDARSKPSGWAARLLCSRKLSSSRANYFLGRQVRDEKNTKTPRTADTHTSALPIGANFLCIGCGSEGTTRDSSATEAAQPKKGFRSLSQHTQSDLLVAFTYFPSSSPPPKASPGAIHRRASKGASDQIAAPTRHCDTATRQHPFDLQVRPSLDAHPPILHYQRRPPHAPRRTAACPLILSCTPRCFAQWTSQRSIRTRPPSPWRDRRAHASWLVRTAHPP